MSLLRNIRSPTNIQLQNMIPRQSQNSYPALNGTTPKAFDTSQLDNTDQNQQTGGRTRRRGANSSVRQVGTMAMKPGPTCADQSLYLGYQCDQFRWFTDAGETTEENATNKVAY